MNTEKPKIDIDTLRIEITEDDLFTNQNIRTNKRYIWTLKDNCRIFAFGGKEEIDNFLKRMFGFTTVHLPNYSSMQLVTFLKKPLLDYYRYQFENGKNPYEEQVFFSFGPRYTIHRDGWDLAGILSIKD